MNNRRSDCGQFFTRSQHIFQRCRMCKYVWVCRVCKLRRRTNWKKKAAIIGKNIKLYEFQYAYLSIYFILNTFVSIKCAFSVKIRDDSFIINVRTSKCPQCFNLSIKSNRITLTCYLIGKSAQNLNGSCIYFDKF